MASAARTSSHLVPSLIRRRRSDDRTGVSRAPRHRAAGDKIGGDYGVFTVDQTVTHEGVGSYVIREALGSGSFGTTYRATTEDGDDIALKVLSFRNMKSWKALELFEREAMTLKALNHPAIPAYCDNFELDTDGDRFFCLAQRIAPGDSLQSLVDSGWRPTEAQVVSIGEQLLEVLIFLASLRPPVCHRDVKPGNVHFDRATGRVSLVDFGAAADAAVNGNGDQKGGGSTVVGTFGYCAPETYMGNATPLSDLYGAGATLLFLLAGVSPSTMPSSRLRVDFRGVVRIESGRLEATVARLLEPSPEDRFGGAGEALAALRGTEPDSVTSNSNSNGGRMGGRIFDRRREGSEDDAEDEMDFWNERESAAQSASVAAVVQANTTAPRRRVRKPAGTRVICERTGSSKLRLVIPPRGLTPGGTYVAGFALAWNSFVAFWTVSALASGGGLLFAAFSIPFWLAGKTVATQAFDEIFEATALEFDAFGFEFTRTATGLVSDGKKGEVADVSGCGLVVESVTNGEPSMCLELEYGAEPVRFGRGLARVELEYVCGEVNSFLDELKGASPLD